MSSAPGYYNIQGGSVAGSNLFHSFSTFNLGTGDTADFNVTSGISNILARVTGGPSSIDGTITSTNVTTGTLSSANLFFLNPAGVMFTANAQVNLGGSFIVSTASYIKFSDGSIFYGDINHPVQDAGLTSAPVSAFGFLTAQPASVTMTDSLLSLNPNLGFHVIAGDVMINDAELDVPSGSLTIFSAASAGEVPFSLASPGSGYAHATNPTYGNVTLANTSYVDIDGNGGGNLVIRGGKLTVDNAIVSSFNSGSIKGGNISVQANQIQIQDGGVIASAAAGSGHAGDISLQGEVVVVDGTEAASGNKTGILSFSTSNIAGSAGSVYIGATGAVSFLNGGQVNINTAGPGANVTVQADSLSIDDTGASSQPTGITVSTTSSTPGSSGLIAVDIAHDMSVTGGGQISSFSFSAADAADINVRAGSLDLDGMGSTFFTGVESEVSGTGNTGSLTFTLDGALIVNNGAQISNSTFSSGNGGDLVINAGSVEVTGSTSSPFLTAIQTTANEAGNGGAITIDTTGSLSVTGDGQISSDTFGAGAAGDISVQAGSLTLIGSIIGSSTLSFSGTPNSGNAGSVSVTVNQAALIESGGLINSGTSSLGHAGTVTVQAGSMTIDGMNVAGLFTGVSDQTTGGATGNAELVTVNVLHELAIQNGGDISSNTFSSGTGGDVHVNAGMLVIDGMDATSSPTGISANTDTGATGNGGSLLVNVSGSATVTGGGEISITTYSPGNAGLLTVNVDGALAVTNGGEISGGTYSPGASGNVTVHAGSLLIDGTGSPNTQTGISSQSNSGATGNSGSVFVDVPGSLVISAGGEISTGTRSTGNAGDTTVEAGSLTIENAAGIPHLTGITSETDGTMDAHGHLTGLGGNAGSVTVAVAGALTMTSGKIDTDTFCSGNAGSVTIQAGSLSIDGSSDPVVLAGIFSDSNGFAGDTNGEGGNAGSVEVSVASGLSIVALGGIGAATFTTGSGGGVTIQAGSVNIDGANAGFTAQAFGAGNGGSLTVNAGTVSLANGAVMTASSQRSNAGTIVVNASSLTLQGTGKITTDAAVNGGNITLNVGSLVYLLNSQITATAGNNGGNIKFDPQFVVLDDSLISANAAAGQGGDISIITSDFLNNDSQITATGSTDGTVTITAPDLDLSGSLIALPAALVSEEKRLREQCARSVNHEYSTLIVVGRGGTEAGPDELQPDFGLHSDSQEYNVAPKY